MMTKRQQTQLDQYNMNGKHGAHCCNRLERGSYVFSLSTHNSTMLLLHNSIATHSAVKQHTFIISQLWRSEPNASPTGLKPKHWQDCVIPVHSVEFVTLPLSAGQTPTFLGSWVPSSIFKASKDWSNPSHTALLFTLNLNVSLFHFKGPCDHTGPSRLSHDGLFILNSAVQQP